MSCDFVSRTVPFQGVPMLYQCDVYLMHLKRGVLIPDLSVHRLRHLSG